MTGRLIALALLTVQTEAPAPPHCLTPGQLGELAVIALPDALDEAARRCRPSLAPEAFLVSEAARAFRQRAEEAAEVRRSGFIADVRRLAGGEESVMTDEQLLRIAVEGAVINMVEPARRGQCRELDAMVEAISPLPAANMSALIASVITLTDEEACQ